MAEVGLLTRADVIGQPWHAVSAEEAVHALGTDREKGLSADEVERRRREMGENRLPERRRETALRVFLHQFQDPLIYILLLAAAVSLGIGNVEDSGFIFAVLLFNAGLGTYQEYRAESAAEALKRVMRVTARVIRGGQHAEVDSGDLVAGDIVSVQAGASVPADIRLLSDQDIRADESLLTGESIPVEKSADRTLKRKAPLSERSTLLHAGSAVISGRGTGVVVRTGALTELGRIAEAVTEEQQVPPLVLRMRRFTRVIAVAILIIFIVLGGAQALRGQALIDIFLLAISRQLHITQEKRDVITGRKIGTDERQGGSDAERTRIRDARIYARVEPGQKTTIVHVLQEAGHFVAVTGDGVNDAPALRAAHIGVAMGASGTDVARNAADLILTDDNFASIVNGVEEGRVAYDNVRKVVWLLISTGVAELVLFALSVAFGKVVGVEGCEGDRERAGAVREAGASE